MTTTGSIADRGTGITTEVQERIRRGVALYSEHHQEIKTLDTGVYRIPSASGRGSYRVNLEKETCQCADRKGRALGACKHTICALIADAKLPTYRIRKTQGDLYELLEKRAGIEQVIGWGTCSETYHMKWALENSDWEMAV